MNMTDETLSAFLDAELTDAEMEAVRVCIAEDESIANRLAELAAVDTQVRDCYSQIDQEPLPDAVLNLLQTKAREAELKQNALAKQAAETQTTQAKATAQPSAKIFAFPSIGRQHLAMAASVAFVVGFGMSQWLTGPSGESPSWQAVAAALDTIPSGTGMTLTEGTQLTPRVTFTNEQGAVCRQYQVQSQHNHTQAVACRVTDSWQQVVALTATSQAGNTNANSYQTASGDSPINGLVETMAVGNFFNRAEEDQAIANQWQTLKPNQITKP